MLSQYFYKASFSQFKSNICAFIELSLAQEINKYILLEKMGYKEMLIYFLNIIPLCSGTTFGGGISPLITATIFLASQIAMSSLASSVAEPM